MRAHLASFAVTVVTVALMLALVASAGAQQVRVVDGDTLAIGDVRYRLWGIDAPERGTAAGAAATAQMRALVASRSVRCEPRDRDRYGRVVAVCYADGRDLAWDMVATGHARDWPRYSGGHYAGAER